MSELVSVKEAPAPGTFLYTLDPHARIFAYKTIKFEMSHDNPSRMFVNDNMHANPDIISNHKDFAMSLVVCSVKLFPPFCYMSDWAACVILRRRAMAAWVLSRRGTVFYEEKETT